MATPTRAITHERSDDAKRRFADDTADDSGERRSLESLPTRGDRFALEGVRVLVVDDDNDSLELLQLVLERAGAVVTSANGASAALEQIDGIDVVVSDIAMPGTDGYEFIRTLRCHPYGNHAPAIALTAFARAEDRERAREAGFQEHLAKPVNTTKLVAAVRRWSRAT